MPRLRLVEELRLRHVWRAANAYVVVGWLLVQVATQVFPFFGIPGWTVQLVVILIAAGFPVALMPAWDRIRNDAGFQALLKKYAKYKPAVIPVAETSAAALPAPTSAGVP